MSHPEDIGPQLPPGIATDASTAMDASSASDDESDADSDEEASDAEDGARHCATPRPTPLTIVRDSFVLSVCLVCVVCVVYVGGQMRV